LLRQTLQQSGHEVIAAANGEEAWARFIAEPCQFVITDWMMPALDGPELIGRIRGAALPGYTYVILLTAKDERTDVVEGLDAGADDYLTKPFSLDELTARMRALLRRDVAREDNVLRHRDLAVDTATHAVTKNGKAIDVSAREFALLAALLERPGAALSKAQLEERIYRWGDEVESNAVEVHIHNLRKKLGSDAIRTLRGVGYALA
jgi:two-component system response regulator QseB